MIYFSIIIPNYNHAIYLKQRIDSILSQTYKHFEIILLDDASNDNSQQVIEEFRGHEKISQILFNPKNSGSPFKQWEKGINYAKGNWVWFAESDDFCSDLFLETAVKHITLHPKIGLFYSNSKYIIGNKFSDTLFSTEKNIFFNTNKWNNDYYSDGKTEIENFLGIKCTINNASGVVLNKELLLPNIKTISDFKHHGDWYCYISVLSESSLSYSSIPLNFYRADSSGIKNKLPEDGKNKMECFRILSYLTDLDLKSKSELVKEFSYNNFSGGFKKERKFWSKAFSLNLRLAFTAFVHILRKRFK